MILKAFIAINSDSVTWQCLGCPFPFAAFPKCSYCTFRGYKSTLLMCSFSNTFPTPSGRFPHPSRFPHVMLWLWLPLSSMSSPHFPPHLCSSPLLSPREGWQPWSNPHFSDFCSIFTAPQHFFPLCVCGWKTSETVFLIQTPIWVNFDSSYFTSPLPQPPRSSSVAFAPLIRLPLFFHTKISMWDREETFLFSRVVDLTAFFCVSQ